MINKIMMAPIGILETPFKSREDLHIPPFLPESPYYDAKVVGTVRLFEEYREGIAGIEPGAYAMLLFYFDRSEGYSLTTKSHRSGHQVGVFSTRSPNRPNGIGITTVQFIKTDGCRLVFRGVDMLDGSPLLDIKPYSGAPVFD